jgi:hypothetical protein
MLAGAWPWIGTGVSRSLVKAGFLPSHGLSVVYLCDIPNGLNEDELEQYLREHGAELRLGPATDSGVETL